MKKKLKYQIAVAISLTIATRDDGKLKTASTPLLFITGPFLIFWQVWPIILKIIHSMVFTWKIFTIAFNTICYVLEVQYVPA